MKVDTSKSDAITFSLTEEELVHINATIHSIMSTLKDNQEGRNILEIPFILGGVMDEATKLIATISKKSGDIPEFSKEEVVDMFMTFARAAAVHSVVVPVKKQAN